jgi:hypothetical protein
MSICRILYKIACDALLLAGKEEGQSWPKVIYDLKVKDTCNH